MRICSFLHSESGEGGSGSQPSHRPDFKQAMNTKHSDLQYPLFQQLFFYSREHML